MNLSTRYRLCTAALGLALAAAVAIPARAAETRELTFGIVPQQSATRLAKEWIPLLRHLSAETGLTLRFQTAKDIPTFEACLAKKAYDVAYMNPYHYTTFHDVADYRAFAHQKGSRLKGLVVVRADSPVTTLKDLAGAEIAFPSPAAFGASVIPRAEMTRLGIPFTPVYVKSHDSVYRAVSSGLYPAGGGVQRTLGTIPEDVRSQLKVIYETAAYTPHAFAASPAVDGQAVTLLATAMASLETAAPDLLKPIGMQGIEKANDADWDDIRSLNLERAATQIIAEGLDTCRSG